MLLKIIKTYRAKHMKIEKTIDRGSRQKLYVQIYKILREKIENGEWPADTQIPTDDELCRMFEVSKVTVREAVHELVHEGYLKRQQGKGTFVTFCAPHIGLMMKTRLTYTLNGKEISGKKEILVKDIRKPPSGIRSLLKTEDNLHFVRSKITVEDCAAIEEFFVPLFEMPVLDVEDVVSRSFVNVLDEKGIKKVLRVEQGVEIQTGEKESSRILNAQTGSPVLVLSRMFYSSDGSPLAYTQLIFPQKNTFSMELERIA